MFSNEQQITGEHSNSKWGEMEYGINIMPTDDFHRRGSRRPLNGAGTSNGPAPPNLARNTTNGSSNSHAQRGTSGGTSSYYQGADQNTGGRENVSSSRMPSALHDGNVSHGYGDAPVTRGHRSGGTQAQGFDNDIDLGGEAPDASVVGGEASVHSSNMTASVAMSNSVFQQQHQSRPGRYSLSGPGGTRGEQARALNEVHVRQLVEQGFSSGLARALASNAAAFDHRIWVVDNSGSMQIGDGHRICEGSKKDDIKAVPSTRWEEIQDSVKYHSQMAALLDSPTIFKLLNDPGSRVGPQQFSVAERGEAMVEEDIRLAIDIMRKAKPGGVTPLTRHIWEIQQSIQEMAPQLVADGRKVVVVLATDGLPTDEQGYGGEYITDEFIRALRSLEGLPVWLVVRLCTDEEPVTRFYNNLDGQLELSLEVLDDFIGEAREVYRHNKWLNYGLPMHRCRELGYHDRLFDLIDERPLTKGELRDFCGLLFGMENLDGVPDPGADWNGFTKYLQAQLKKEKQQWNPIKKKMMPWISVKVLNKCYGQKSACTIM